MGLNGLVSDVCPRSKAFKAVNPFINWSTMKVATNSVVQYTTWSEEELKFTLSGSVGSMSSVDVVRCEFGVSLCCRNGIDQILPRFNKISH